MNLSFAALFVVLFFGSLHAQSFLAINDLYFTIYSQDGQYPVTLEAKKTPLDPAQAWTIKQDGTITTIASVAYPGVVLAIAFDNADGGQVVGIIAPVPPTDSQTWIVNQDGSISSQLGNGLYLDGFGDGTDTYAWTDSPNPPPTVEITDFKLPTNPPTIPPTQPPTTIPPTKKLPTAAPTKSPSAPPTKVPTIPPTIPPTAPPTVPPTAPPTVPPTSPPTVPPTIPPTDPPTSPPTIPPTTMPPTIPPTSPPTAPPTAPPTDPPTSPPTIPPTTPPTIPPTTIPPTIPPTTPPTIPPTTPPTIPPTTIPPTKAPTTPPTQSPTTPPTQSPTAPPTSPPTTPPTKAPTAPPTQPPTIPPTKLPTIPPTNAPTVRPTVPPTRIPTLTAPIQCNAYADVHYKSFLNTYFDNQGVGFFQLATFGIYQITSRTKPCPGGFWGRSCNAGVVLSFGGNNIEISEGDVLRVNSGYRAVGNGGSIVVDNVRVLKNYAGYYTVTFPNGYFIYEQYAVNFWANIYITLYAGAPVPGGLCTRAIFKRSAEDDKAWGEQFRVTTAAATGFTFTEDNTFEDLNDPNFEQQYGPVESTDTELIAKARKYCSVLNGNLGTTCGAYADSAVAYQDCVNDILATGNLGIGAGAVNAFTSTCSFNAAKENATVAIPPSAITTTASGAGIGAEILSGLPYTFTITTKDSTGKKITPSVNSFEITSTAGITFSLLISNSSDIIVSYTASSTIGTYTISVKYLGADHIAGSPFTVTIKSKPTYFKLFSGLANGLYLDLENGATAAGTRVVVANSSNSDTQRWSFTPEGYILNLAAGLVVDIKSGTIAVNNPIIIWNKKPKASAINQLWTYNNTTSVFVSNANSNFVIDAPGTVSGTPVALWYKKAPPQYIGNQQFTGSF